MTLHRFFVDGSTMVGDRFPVPAAVQRQVRGVLRLRDGDRIVLLRNDGSEALCRLDGDDCVVEQRRPVTTEPRHSLVVVQALLRGDALEEVVQHATEIGVARFRLAVTDRCVARELSPRRLERLRTIAREAAEQSERGRVPPVDAPLPLREVVERGCVVLYERHDGALLSEIPPPAAIAIGPEGGFSPSEIDAARAAGATLAGLGPRILRSSTVATAAASVILSATRDFA